MNEFLHKSKKLSWTHLVQKGYGLTLIVVFLLSSVLLASSLKIALGPLAGSQNTSLYNRIAANHIVQAGLKACKDDIIAKLNSGTLVTTAYRYPALGSNTVTVPDDPNNLGGVSSVVGSYFATVTHARGNSYFVRVTATSGSSVTAASALFFASGEPTLVADIMLIGRNAGDQMGYPVSAAGDVDGDGVDDFIVGAKNSGTFGTNTGEAYLVFGRSSTNWNSLIDANADFDMDGMSDANRTVRLIGRSSWDYAGRTVSSAGDVNNDGYDDILIGADRAPGSGGANAGEAYLILGRNASDWLAFTDANGDFDLNAIDEDNGVYQFNGISNGDDAGYFVSSAGDVNNDGYNDILIGTRNIPKGGESNVGSVYLLFGRSTADWKMLATNGQYNLSDVLGDANNTFQITGRDPGDRAGVSVASAGDVNNDGYDDILIGAHNADEGSNNRGEVYLILGRSDVAWGTLMAGGQEFDLDDIDLVGTSNVFRFIGRSGNDDLGEWVSSAGDVNNDGYDDILMGSEDADAGGLDAGEVYLVLGRSTADWNTLTDAVKAFDLNNIHLAGSTNMFRFIGRNPDDEAGGSVSSAGDVNNDGYDDILIGASTADGGGGNSGEVYLILGRSTANWFNLVDANKDFNLDNISDANQMARFFGKNGGHFLGGSASGIGDINNDGYDDLMMAAHYADGGGADSGEVYLFFGRNAVKWAELTDANGHFNLDDI